MDEHAFPPTGFLWLGSAARYKRIKQICWLLSSCVSYLVDSCTEVCQEYGIQEYVVVGGIKHIYIHI